MLADNGVIDGGTDLSGTKFLLMTGVLEDEVVIGVSEDISLASIEELELSGLEKIIGW